MVAAAVLGGVAGAGVGAGGNIGQSFLSDQWAQSASARQRHWEEMMYDTRYQRAVTDLKAAGLNPALAYTQGIAGGTPSASAPSARADFGDVTGSFMKGVSSAKQAMLTKANLDTAEAAADKVKADASSAQSDATLRRTVAEFWPGAEMDKKTIEYENLFKTQQLLDLQIQGSTADNYRKRLENTIRGWDLPAAITEGKFDLEPRGQKAIQFRRMMEAFIPFMSNTKGAVSYGTKTGGLFREKGED